MKKLHYLFAVMALVATFVACEKNEVTATHPDEIALAATSRTMNADEAQKQFAQLLSKAVYNDENLRAFLKEEALKQIDNDYNIFYPLSKNKLINGKSFREILLDYTENSSEIAEIEAALPLLNIHLPNFGDTPISKMDTKDNEIPVLLDRDIYLDGNVVDSLENDEIPFFNIFVITESSSIRLKSSMLRTSNGSSIDGKYEYVDKSFDPSFNKATHMHTRFAEYDQNLPEKYTERGYIPKADIDPLLLEAYHNSSNNTRATRCMMYYGLKNQNETPTTLRYYVHDCLFRFKIAESSFMTIEDIATKGNKPLFYYETTNKKNRLSRDVVLNRLLTGRSFIFLFQIQGKVENGYSESKELKIFAKPEKLFNLKISEHRRHPTMFRHTKYTYKIVRNGIKSKWFYPLENGHDSRFDKWDIATEPLEKRIVAYIVNPEDGAKEEITDTYSTSSVNGFEVGANIEIPIDKITLGINGKLNGSNTYTKTVTTKYTILLKNKKIDAFMYHFFNDYPIHAVYNARYIIPGNKGKGAIETTILPISNDFFYRRYN